MLKLCGFSLGVLLIFGNSCSNLCVDSNFKGQAVSFPVSNEVTWTWNKESGVASINLNISNIVVNMLSLHELFEGDASAVWQYLIAADRLPPDNFFKQAWAACAVRLRYAFHSFVRIPGLKLHHLERITHFTLNHFWRGVLQPKFSDVFTRQASGIEWVWRYLKPTAEANRWRLDEALFQNPQIFN